MDLVERVVYAFNLRIRRAVPRVGVRVERLRGTLLIERASSPKWEPFFEMGDDDGRGGGEGRKGRGATVKLYFLFYSVRTSSLHKKASRPAPLSLTKKASRPTRIFVWTSLVQGIFFVMTISSFLLNDRS